MSEHLNIILEGIKKKKVVLFLGSGFAYNAKHPDKKQAPLGKELGDLISDKFLNGNYKDGSLAYISDLAISTSNLYDVQNYIHEIFSKYKPNENHLKYACLPWRAIFTTNYDTILEDAYSSTETKNVQDLSVVVQNTPIDQIYKTPNTIPYFKLHGCITHINDDKLPLILSSDQYLKHLDNRDRLFKKFEELSQDFSIIFIGYSNQDHNIRAILAKLEALKEGRPRSYMVSPGFTEIEISYWESKKITPINMGHEEFISHMFTNISETDKQLSTFIRKSDRKIEEKFSITFDKKAPTDSLLNFLDHEVDYINAELPLGDSSPQEFYKGNIRNWDPIIKNLDVRRNFEDRILTDLMFEDKYLRKKEPYLFLIKGFAGSGKTVALKRLAWESGVQFGKCTIYIKDETPIRVKPILELYSYVKERIYIYVDNLIENEAQIRNLILKAEREEIEISIISAERTNQLNGQEQIESYITKNFQLNYLSEREVDELISKLEKNNSLGFLKNKSSEERKKELAEKTGRVLLVALYEATGGKPFEEIILDEYNSLPTPELRAIYLTIAVFHRLNTKVRAGLINRIHGISFSHFKEELFKPLEYIVFDEMDYKINDYVYSTRHPYIAQIVFELVLKDQQERYDEYISILQNIDIDYRSDWFAFLDIVNARNLNEIFNDPQRITNIYNLANEINNDDPKLIQQMGIFQMISDSGSLYKSHEYLKLALEIDPKDLRILHSLAELALKRGEFAQSDLEKKQFLEESRKLCLQILKQSKEHSFSYHTLLKIDLHNFREALSKDSEKSVEQNIKSFEKTLAKAKQIVPNEPFILELEAKFKELIDEKPNAIEILKKAYSLNDASPFIAIRYAKLLDSSGNTSEAITCLKNTLKLNPSDKNISYLIANYHEKLNPTDHEDITHYYRRSFTKNDTNYNAHFRYARALYLKGEKDDAGAIFEELSKVRLSPRVKNNAAGVIVNPKNEILEFTGNIVSLESNYAFVKVDKLGEDIFMFGDRKISQWIDFRVNSKLKFNIAFNYKGPTIINPKLM